MERQSIGDIIRENRSKQGLTQKELGEQLNVTDKAVSKWERNIARPDINTIPKLAQILEVPVAELLNLPNVENEESQIEDQEVTKSETEAAAMTEAEYQHYEKRRRENLTLLIVQAIGAILGVIAVITDDHTLLEMLAGFLVMPLACAGFLRFFVRTFQVVRMKLGQRIYDEVGNYYVVPRNGLGVVGCFVAFGLFTCVLTELAPVKHTTDILVVMMGLIEIFLLYRDIKIVCTAGCGGASINVVIVFAVIMLVLSGIVAFLWFSADDAVDANEDVPETAVPTEYQPLNATDFAQIASEFEYVREKAGKYVLAEENEDRESNYEIVIPSSLKAAYFMTETNAAKKYYDFGTGTYVNNAILVVGHYNVNIANTSPRDEWVICVFPNFIINTDGKPTYDEASEYCEYLQANSLEDVYTWMCKEYEGMMLSLLDVPLD